jgi:pimeloyl-ACP methyl ester carboxylesterase
VGYTTRTVDSAGVALATRDYGGTGPALVLMHGAGMEQGSLEKLARQLQPAFRVVTFDFRGHGGTDRVTWTFASAVADVAAVADAYGLGVPAVAGHSLGGMVAAAYGREHPTCPGVVNIDGHGLGRVEQYLGCDEAEVRAWWAQQQRRLDRMTTGPGGVLLRALMVVLRQKPATTMETSRQVHAEVDGEDLFALYREVRCPLLVFNATAAEDRPAMRLLVGKGVPLLTAYRRGLGRDLTALATDSPTTQWVEVDATHMVIKTHPELVARHITSFLQAHAPALGGSSD